MEKVSKLKETVNLVRVQVTIFGIYTVGIYKHLYYLIIAFYFMNSLRISFGICNIYICWKPAIAEYLIYIFHIFYLLLEFDHVEYSGY